MRTAAPVSASSTLSALSRDADRSRLNARSDPRYLVRYYRGARDPARTPYARPEDLPKPPVQLAQRDDTEDALMRADDEEHDTAARQLQLDRLQAEAEAEGEGKEQAKAAESLARVEAICEEVSDQLADGRPYLFGDHFCGAELTFAALGSFAVLPEKFWLVEREHLMLSRLHPQAQEQVICRFRAKRKAAYQSETLARQPRGAPGERVCDERGRERMPIEHSTEDRRIFLSSPPPPPRSIDYFFQLEQAQHFDRMPGRIWVYRY